MSHLGGETAKDWRIKYQNNFESQEGVELFTVPRQGHSSIVSHELVTEIKTILHNIRVIGGVISRETVIAVGNGVLSSSCPEKLTKIGGSVALTTKCTRGILTSLDLVERRGTTAEREMNPALYEELTLTWKRIIASAILKNSIYSETILNFDQTPLGFTAPNKATFAEKGGQSVPIANVNDKRQITGTFCVNVSGKFLPIQLIYSVVTDSCHPKVKYHGSFSFTPSSNQWTNEPIFIDYFKKIIFPFHEKKRKDLKLEKMQRRC